MSPELKSKCDLWRMKVTSLLPKHEQKLEPSTNAVISSSGVCVPQQYHEASGYSTRILVRKRTKQDGVANWKLFPAKYFTRKPPILVKTSLCYAFVSITETEWNVQNKQV